MGQIKNIKLHIVTDIKLILLIKIRMEALKLRTTRKSSSIDVEAQRCRQKSFNKTTHIACKMVDVEAQICGGSHHAERSSVEKISFMKNIFGKISGAMQ